MENFVREHFPDFLEIYNNYCYPVQRWDVIRYLILFKIGGMYVDFDYECISSFNDFIENDAICYFSMEPKAHCHAFGKNLCFNNALMITPPAHPFFEYIITHLQNTPIKYTGRKMHDVLLSTGPLMLTNLFETYKDKNTIGFFSAEQVSPLTKMEVQGLINKTADIEELEKKTATSIAIHYFWGSWLFS